MNNFFYLYDIKAKKYWLISLTLVALILRLFVLFSTVERIYDGPLLSLLAYKWSQSPTFITHGHWTPGFRYLTGIFNWIIPNSLYATRLFNVILGTLTIPVFYWLLKKIYGNIIAIIAAMILVFLPIHIGMSASSLTETSFLLEILVGSSFIIKASNSEKNSIVYLSLACLFIVLAEATRYEGWIIALFFSFFYLAKTKKLLPSIFSLLILLVFPIFWLFGNYSDSGNLLPIYADATTRGESVSLLSAILIMLRQSASQLGWLLTIAVILGLGLKIFKLAKREIRNYEFLYLGILIIYWAFMLYLTIKRGDSLRERFLLFGLVTSLPFAAFLGEHIFNNSRKWLLGFTIIIITSMLVTRLNSTPVFYAVKSSSSINPSLTQLREVAVWLKNSPYSEDFYLLAPMDLGCFYLIHFFPESSDRYKIILLETEKQEIEPFILNHKPSLFIMSNFKDDRVLKSRLEKILNEKLGEEKLVYKKKSVKVYDIR